MKRILGRQDAALSLHVEANIQLTLIDPCSLHHWVMGTGGQSQADHPGNGAG